MCQLFSAPKRGDLLSRRQTDGIAIACAPVGDFSRWGVGSFFVLLQPSSLAALDCSGPPPVCVPVSYATCTCTHMRLGTVRISAEPVGDCYKNWATSADLKGEMRWVFCAEEPQAAPPCTGASSVSLCPSSSLTDMEDGTEMTSFSKLSGKPLGDASPSSQLNELFTGIKQDKSKEGHFK